MLPKIFINYAKRGKYLFYKKLTTNTKTDNGKNVHCLTIAVHKRTLGNLNHLLILDCADHSKNYTLITDSLIK